MNKTSPINPCRLTLPKFLVVGILGTFSNLAIFFVLVDHMQMGPSFGATTAFVISLVQNYLLNHCWTFKEPNANSKLSMRALIRYLVVSLGGLSANLIVLWIVIFLYDPPWKVIGQSVGIGAGTLINYRWSKYWVFVRRK